MRTIPGFLLPFVACCALGSVAFAQERPLPPIVEKTTVSVTNVDVEVLGPGGTHVKGLTATDFEIYEDGAVQRITNFSAVERAPEGATRRAGAATEFTPAFAMEEPRRRIALVVDRNRVSRHGLDVAIRTLEKRIVDGFEENAEWSVTAIGREATLVLPFTSDRGKIVAALESVRTGRSRVGQASLDNRRYVTRDPDADQKSAWSEPDPASPSASSCFLGQLAEFEQYLLAERSANAVLSTLRGLGSFEGKKLVLLITDDFSFYEIAQSACGRVDWLDRTRLLAMAVQLRDLMIQEANASGANVFVINVEGLAVPGFDMGSRGPSPRRLVSVDAAPLWLARMSGGDYYPGNSMTDSIDRFGARWSSYYSLGYSPQRPPDGQYHELRVRLKKQGVHFLTYRRGYAHLTDEQQLERALQTPEGIAAQRVALPLELLLSQGETPESVHFHASLPAGVLRLVEKEGRPAGRAHVYLVVFDAAGRPVKFEHVVRELAAAGPFDYEGTVAVRDPSSQIAVVVRDEVTEELGIRVARR